MNTSSASWHKACKPPNSFSSKYDFRKTSRVRASHLLRRRLSAGNDDEAVNGLTRVSVGVVGSCCDDIVVDGGDVDNDAVDDCSCDVITAPDDVDGFDDLARVLLYRIFTTFEPDGCDAPYLTENGTTFFPLPSS